MTQRSTKPGAHEVCSQALQVIAHPANSIQGKEGESNDNGDVQNGIGENVWRSFVQFEQYQQKPRKQKKWESLVITALDTFICWIMTST